MRLFLIGFMGSGKSHVGSQLAERMQLPFIDLDNQIEIAQQRLIRTIFEMDGEMAFREMERAALHELLKHQNIIIACGGGTPCFFDNMEWMNQHGITIYLEASVNILLERLESERAHRPLLKNMDDIELRQFIENKLIERNPFYNQAHLIYKITSVKEDVAGILHQQFSNIIGH